MEQTATTAPQQQRRFARESSAPAAAPVAAPAPPATTVSPAALRTIQRRWPRTVPEKRIFPRG